MKTYIALIAAAIFLIGCDRMQGVTLDVAKQVDGLTDKASKAFYKESHNAARVCKAAFERSGRGVEGRSAAVTVTGAGDYQVLLVLAETYRVRCSSPFDGCEYRNENYTGRCQITNGVPTKIDITKESNNLFYERTFGF